MEIAKLEALAAKASIYIVTLLKLHRIENDTARSAAPVALRGDCEAEGSIRDSSVDDVNSQYTDINLNKKRCYSCN